MRDCDAATIAQAEADRGRDYQDDLTAHRNGISVFHRLTPGETATAPEPPSWVAGTDARWGWTEGWKACLRAQRDAGQVV